ncbi:MAG TPA: response regulator transcription factor [Ideonella sp.]|nr:response regulator transcription factor [Ideonella sp.]
MQYVGTITISIVHKDPLVQAGLASTLAAQPDFIVEDAAACTPGTGGRRCDVVVADYDAAIELLSAGAWQGACARTGRTRILVLTQVGREADIRHALECGVQGYLLLGCSLDEVVSAVRSVHRGMLPLCALAAKRLADSMIREPLTLREKDVLGLMMTGQCNKTIAGHLNIAVGTVKSHVKAILDKLEATSRTEAVAVAESRGLIRRSAQPAALQPQAPAWRLASLRAMHPHAAALPTH